MDGNGDQDSNFTVKVSWLFWDFWILTKTNYSMIFYLVDYINWQMVWASFPALFSFKPILLFCIRRVITVTRVCSVSQVVTEIPVFENICYRISGEIEFVGNIWLWLPIIRPFTPPLFVFPRSQLASLLRLYVATLVIVIIQY